MAVLAKKNVILRFQLSLTINVRPLLELFLLMTYCCRLRMAY